MRISRKAWLLIVICAGAPSASAEAPVAIVEDVKGQVTGLEAMDYLAKGRTIRLTPDDAVVIGYLDSCVREAIRGGTIEIGETESKVESGVVERGKVECDARRMIGAPGLNLESTGFISRGDDGNESLPTVPRAPPPEFTLYGSSPLVELNGGGTLVIARTRQDRANISAGTSIQRSSRVGDSSISRQKASRSRQEACTPPAGRSASLCSTSTAPLSPAHPRSSADC